jgi:hypothetical protein
MGLSDGIEAAEAAHSKSLSGRTVYCDPGRMASGQVRDVFVKYLRDHPEERHQIAELLFLLAMQKAFPCR